jgi:hypothetical protein
MRISVDFPSADWRSAIRRAAISACAPLANLSGLSRSGDTTIQPFSTGWTVIVVTTTSSGLIDETPLI